MLNTQLAIMLTRKLHFYITFSLGTGPYKLMMVLTRHNKDWL
jgi:hypothetical protein